MKFARIASRHIASLIFITQLFLSACSLYPPTPQSQQALPSGQELEKNWKTHQENLLGIAEWSLLGKLGLRSPKENGSARISWQQQGQTYQLYFTDPLGRTALQLTGDSRYTTVIAPNQEPFTTNEPEKILLNQTGWQIPVTELPHWVLGSPAPNQPATYTLNIAGRLASLNQAGWRLDFESYQQSGDHWLPKKINMKQGEVKLKLVINEWTIPHQSTASIVATPINKEFSAGGQKQ